MRTLAFDGRMGASGDMLLGALLAAGADPGRLEPVEAALEVTYEATDADVGGIAATRVRVLRDGEPVEASSPRRTLDEVTSVLDELALDEPVDAAVRESFERLIRAEARVHGEEPTTVHLHEAGGDDAIADVVGVALLLDDLDPDRVVTTPVAVGGGEVEMAHGTYPVPPPAVVAIAEDADWSIRGGPVEAELLTPTGAALLAQFAAGVDALPPMAVEASGYGAGSRSFDRHPNVLRAMFGTSRGLGREDITVLETNLDDTTPEVLGGLHEALAEVGARDVTILPTTMKKARPGHLVQVIVRPEDAQRVARRLAEETGTLGVRETSATHRWVADRRVEPVSVSIDGRSYEIDVKVAADAAGEVYDASAEYDDAARVAGEVGVPVREVMRRAVEAWWERSTR